MEVIPVLDVRAGVAVRANGGDRSRYPPLRTVLANGSEPLALAGACRERLGTAELYVADLDAISAAREGGLEVEELPAGRPGPRGLPVAPLSAAAARLVTALSAGGSAVWVDAGTRDAREVERLLEAGAARVVIGLETLRGLEALRRLAEVFGGGRLAFSLDVRGERPVTSDRDLSVLPARRIAAAAAMAGFTEIVVLDLDRVGRGWGPPLGLLRRLTTEIHEARFLAGGGVRGVRDLVEAATAGCAACLVGSAIHRGQVGRREIEELRNLKPRGAISVVRPIDER